MAQGVSNPRTLAKHVETWFREAARDLPWRRRRTAWRSLVSEFMLQQTQVSRVVDRFEPFLKLFPTPRSMSAASEDEVVRAWSGLGYYRRARSLHKLSRAIVREHGGRVPTTVAGLVGLPGVGRYTAGAIASIVHGEPVAIVDGNVARVLLRVRGDHRCPTDRQVVDDVWKWAEQYVQGSTDPCLANEGLMELGALVCTPKSPQCEACPLRRKCVARRAGLQELIPVRSTLTKRREERVHALVILRRGKLLLSQRRMDELWAGMMLPPMVGAADSSGSARDASGPFGAAGRRAGAITFDTSSCRLHITVWRGASVSASALSEWFPGASTSWVPRTGSPEVLVGVTARILDAAGV